MVSSTDAKQGQQSGFVYAEHCVFMSTEAEEAQAIQVTREPGILHLHTATVNNLVLFTQN